MAWPFGSFLSSLTGRATSAAGGGRRDFGMGARHATRSFEGAGGGRRWRGFGPTLPPLVAQIAQRGTLARRAQHLTANNPMAAAAAEAWVSAIVGTGIKPQATHPDSTLRAETNARWERWTDVADADGLCDFYALQALAVRRMVIDGEVFIVLSHGEDGALRLRLIDAEQVDGAMSRQLDGGGRIIAGIEFDADGRRTAYHVYKERPGLPLAGSPATIRVPAEDMLHLFRATAPGQVRGVSWFAAVLLRITDYDKATDAQLVRQLVAALLAGFIIDTAGGAAGFDGAPDGAGSLDGGLEPGTLKVLGPGQDIRFSEPAKVGSEVIDFLAVTAREIAAGLGVPASVITGNYADANYSSLRAALVDFRRRVEAVQYHTIVFQMCRPVWRRFVTAEILSGRLAARGFVRDPEPFLGASWITPRQEWVDPGKDVEAEITAIGAGLMSRRQAVAARGYDLEALDAEIAADNARAAALGLSFAAGDAPSAVPSDREMSA